jgi:hypothetical protein
MNPDEHGIFWRVGDGPPRPQRVNMLTFSDYWEGAGLAGRGG